jgi:hypothetical protein
LTMLHEIPNCSFMTHRKIQIHDNLQ